MALTATVTPGYTWATGEAITLAALNLAANPSVSIEGTIGSTVLSNGAVTEPKLGTGAVTVNKLGDDAVTAAKLKDTDSFVVGGLAIASAAPGLTLRETSATNVAFLVQDNGVLQAQMRLASNEATLVATPFKVLTNAPDNSLVVGATGAVGLGTVTPSEVLEVVGAVKATAFKVGSDAGVDATLTFTGTLNGGGSGTRTLVFKKGLLTSAS